MLPFVRGALNENALRLIFNLWLDAAFVCFASADELNNKPALVSAGSAIIVFKKFLRFVLVTMEGVLEDEEKLI
jgi:hypothetical protein